LAEDTYALLDELKIDKFKAMGMSGGAMALIHMATMDTSRIEAMVVISGTSYFDNQYRDFGIFYLVSLLIATNCFSYC